jgi:hypothetical protein
MTEDYTMNARLCKDEARIDNMSSGEGSVSRGDNDDEGWKCPGIQV